MKTDLISTERVKTIGHLLEQYKRREMLSMHHLTELESHLNPDELEISADTLVILKARSLCNADKLVQGYHVMLEGLKKMPTSLSLQYERRSMMAAAQTGLSDLMHQDPLHPMIEPLYDLLRRDSGLLVAHQFQYLKFLVGYQRFAEAAKLAVPLVALYPVQLQLREQVEIIAQKTQQEVLLQYLMQPAVRMGVSFEAIPMSTMEAYNLSERLVILRDAISESVPIHVTEKYLAEVIGEVNFDSTLNSNLKEFYYVWAIVEESKKNYLNSILMLRSLIELDPCQLNFRNMMDQVMRSACGHLSEQAEKGALTLDLMEVYEVLRELGHVSYALLTHVAIAEVKAGQIEKAKQKMNSLIALNPLDSVYLGAAQKVAEAAMDSLWLGDLHRMMARIAEERPWDLELQVNLEHLEKTQRLSLLR